MTQYQKIVFWLFLWVILVLCTSCKTKYVPVESIRTEIEYRDRWQRDSIHVHDSIVIQSKGDTIFRDRWHTLYRDRFLCDTTYIYITDSVQVPYPVERPLSRWQRAKLELGGWAFGAIILFSMVIVGWIVKKNRNR